MMNRQWWKWCWMGVWSLIVGNILVGQPVGISQLNMGEISLRPQLVSPQWFSEQNEVKAGEQTWVALRMKIATDWHLYWQNYGDSGGNIRIHWQLPDGFSAGEEQYPVPEWMTTRGVIISYGHEKELVLLVPITVASDVPHGRYTLRTQVEWYVCREDQCIDGKEELLLVVSVGPQNRIDERNTALFAQARKQLPPAEVTKDIRFVVENGKPSLIFPASLIQGARPVAHRMPPRYPAYFFPEQPVIKPNSIQAPKVDGGQARMAMGWESGGRNTQLLKGLLVVGKPSNGLPYTVYRVEAPREENSPVAAVVSEQPVASATARMETNWQAEWQGREDQLPGLGTTYGFTMLDGGSGQITGLSMALALAFVGGLILNVMPCVFPVLGLKVMGFVKQAGGERSKIRRHGLIFTLGVLLSFWVLVGILLILRSTLDASVGWGFQMQDPFFIALVVLLFFFFGLSLSGVFEFGSSFMSVGGKAQSREGYTGSLFSGIFATLVATPCVGPFLGPVLGFTLTLAEYEVVLVFTFLALGLSFPYLIAAFFPATLALLPRPGAWMETFKQLLAFPMYAAAIYFLWSFGRQTASIDNLIWFLLALLVIALAAWIWGRWAVPVRTKRVRRLALLTAWLLIVGAVGIAWQASEVDEQALARMATSAETEVSGDWVLFSPDALQAAQDEGRAVYVDFTAAWCAVCQANKLIAFEGPGSERVWQRIDELNVVMMRADWTRKDALIYHYLQSFGYAGVPLNVLYLPPEQSQQPIVMPALLFPHTVLDALDRIE